MKGKFSRLVRRFTTFPGVGEKTALRFTLFLIQADEKWVENFCKDILEFKRSIKLCKECFMVSENEICEICSDESRDRSRICVVESVEDVWAVEKSKSYNGLYHVLWGLISASEGTGPQDIRIKELVDRVSRQKPEEVIILTDTTVEGEATSIYLKKLLESLGVKVTRPAYGIPVGVEVVYMDPMTIKRALESRKKL